jgi:hypothetical protein
MAPSVWAAVVARFPSPFRELPAAALIRPELERERSTNTPPARKTTRAEQRVEPKQDAGHQDQGDHVAQQGQAGGDGHLLQPGHVAHQALDRVAGGRPGVVAHGQALHVAEGPGPQVSGDPRADEREADRGPVVGDGPPRLMATTAAPHSSSVCMLASMDGPGLRSVAPRERETASTTTFTGQGSTRRKATSNVRADESAHHQDRWPCRCGRTQRSVRRSPDSGFGGWAGRRPRPGRPAGFRSAQFLP